MRSCGARLILALAIQEKRILLTFDLDFGEILAFRPEPVTGVVLFRLQGARAARIQERLAVCLAQAADALEAGGVVVVEDGRLRIRHWRLLPRRWP